jgi:hypothetical protein
MNPTNTYFFGAMNLMPTSNIVKKLSIAAAGAAFLALGIGGAAQATSLIGDTINYEYIFPDASNVYQTNTTTVAAGASDIINAIGIFSINPEATSFLASNFSFNSSWTTAEFNGFRLSDLNFDDGSTIVGFSFETNMEGLDASRISFTKDSVSVNWNSLAFNRDTYLRVNLDTDRTSVPEPASVLGLLAVGALGAGSARKRQQSQKA